MREVERGLGQPDVLDGAGRRFGDEERVRIGEADVFGREDDEPARDEARVLARFEHAREPVQARIGIGAADRLDERGDDVVVLVVAVANGCATRARLRRRRARSRCGRASTVERVRDLEHREQMAGVALALVDEMLERVVVDRRGLGAEAALVVGERAVRELVAASSSSSGSSRNSVLRESSGPVSEKNGFSVVAPTRTSSPSSTNGSSTSCCAWLKRCTSSRKRIVPWPCSPSRARARSATSRTSFTPALDTADSVSNALALTPAMRRAMVVLPVPGGPQRMSDDSRSDFDQDPQRLARPEQVLLADDLVERSAAAAAPRAAPGAPAAPRPPPRTDRAPSPSPQARQDATVLRV